uniref:Uncharacterized protein n=1 Tax=Felis catus TaxID=9685 RepID=A0ABI7WUT5_FELCA
RQARPHSFLGGLLLPLLLRVAVVGQVAAAVGRASAQLALAVGRQRVVVVVVGRVVVVALRRGRLVGAGRRPGVVGGAATAELRAQPGRGLEAAAAAGALGPRLALQAAGAGRVLVLGRGARRPAHQARQGRVVGPPARGAGGPGAARVAQGLPAAAARPVVLLGRVVLVEAPEGVRLRALEAAAAPRLVAVAVGPAGARAVRVGEGGQLVHGDGRHPGGEVLPGQHLGLGALLAEGEWCWSYSVGSGPTKQGARLGLPYSLAR